MSEIMRPIPFKELINWMITEYKNSESIFGIRKIYKNTSGNTATMFNDSISSVIGPAAGPHSQLAQNIIASYIAGARFVELKTVQIIDGKELRECIGRPCITAEDEGYNCEWSTELTVTQAYEEYVKAFVICIIMAKELGISNKRDFVFNMSVGYDFEGITSKKIDTFISDMIDSSNNEFFNQCKKDLYEMLGNFSNITKEDVDNLDTNISSSITLSTLHGCPPEEIEKIANYFLVNKKTHTYVKCNPTLLGYDFTRNMLDEMGYKYIQFDDTHFLQDLKYEDALGLIKRLKDTAKKESLDFGVKITNTFPVKVTRKELPSEFMYMSGRSLYPLSLSVASMLSKDFDGKLPISFSGGVDFFNVKELFKVGIMPITVATTILKPGGYERLTQLAKEVEGELSGEFKGVDVESLSKLAKEVSSKKRHQKGFREVASRKVDSILPLFDCVITPCSKGGCPIDQQIPTYLEYVSKKEYAKAFEVIVEDNVLPATTGAICNHDCMTKCTRMDYDGPIKIREAKLEAVKNAQNDYLRNIVQTPLKTKAKVAIIGAGPAGVAAATYLRRSGVGVRVFEKTNKAMGIVEHIIPEFRISKEMIAMDYELSVRTGVEYEFNCYDNYFIKQLKKDYDFVILATGAWGKGRNSVKEGKDKLIDALDFLIESKKSNNTLSLGEKVAVIGGGDVAMDCVRAAIRTTNVLEADIVYRRTEEYMPVSREELDLAKEDGAGIVELLSPIAYDGKKLTLEVMKLVEQGIGKRPKPTPTGEIVEREYDTVISAVGAKVGKKDFVRNNIKLNDWGCPVTNIDNQSSIPDVYIAGDCNNGAATIVQAMADSKIIAKAICEKLNVKWEYRKHVTEATHDEQYEKKGVLEEESPSCLHCDLICELCVDVCPNRANIAIAPNYEILHVDGMCNECGNCAVFCPHIGSPYLDKPTIFWSEEDFKDSKNSGFLKLNNELYRFRNEYKEVFDAKLDDAKVSPKMRSLIEAVNNNYSYLFMN